MSTLFAESQQQIDREVSREPNVVTRLPNRQVDTRVAEILGLLDRPTREADGSTGVVLADLEQERRRLHHALTMLRTARQKLHEQYLANKEEQQRVVTGLQREWAARRRQMETQLATAAMTKAREELADERGHLEAEFQQRDMEWQRERDEQQRQLSDEQARIPAILDHHNTEKTALRSQLDSVRDQHARLLEERHAELQSQQDGFQKQLNDVRGQLVQAEFALVKDRAEWADERRRWSDERQKAESIIEDLLGELESRTKKRAA